jgi:hypothetical protein
MLYRSKGVLLHNQKYISMKDYMQNLLKSMRGVFLPADSTFRKDLESLDYYDSKYDKINLRNDISMVCRDVRKATDEAKKEFKLAM